MLGLQFAILYVKTNFLIQILFFSQLNNPDPQPAVQNNKRGNNVTFQAYHKMRFNVTHCVYVIP